MDTGADTEKLQIKESFIVMSCAWEEKKKGLYRREKNPRTDVNVLQTAS